MLNYIWSGLIILSLVFAMVQDGYDIAQNTYENGVPKKVTVNFPQNQETRTSQKVHFSIPWIDTVFSGTWKPSKSGTELVFGVNNRMPELWQNVAQHQQSDEKETIRAKVMDAGSTKSGGTYQIMLPKVRFVKLRAITDAAFNMAKFAVQLAIGLIGAMALWLGLMKIAEESGLIHTFNKMVQPVLKYLFPDIPRDHPAFAAISLNIAANVLGLGNAATPLGIKAMEELQELNDGSETASDAMCMFLAINTSSVQLLPPVTLVALLGTGVNEIMITIILATSVSTIAGILAAKWFARRSRIKSQPAQ